MISNKIKKKNQQKISIAKKKNFKKNKILKKFKILEKTFLKNNKKQKKNLIQKFLSKTFFLFLQKKMVIKKYS